MTTKLAVITGSSGEIGQAVSESLLAENFKVIGVDIEPKKEKLNYEHIQGSVEDFSIIEKVFIKVRELQPDFFVLINNAGVSLPFENTANYWDKTIRINLSSPFFWMESAANYFEEMKCGGRIISITSLSAEMAFPNNPAYMASKGGLKQLTKSFGLRLGRLGICCNNVGPGYIQTKFNSKSLEDPGAYDIRRQRSILNRWGTPFEVANTVSFLSSEKANFITCQDIYVDGGWLAKGI